MHCEYSFLSQLQKLKTYIDEARKLIDFYLFQTNDRKILSQPNQVFTCTVFRAITTGNANPASDGAAPMRGRHFEDLFKELAN